MAKELMYRLSNPTYTIYHRAALGGLAATVRAWGNDKPLGIDAEVQKDLVRIAWGSDISDQEAVKRILESSFRLTDDKLIELPGQGIREDQTDLRLALHEGICGTFLQLNTTHVSDGLRHIEIKSADDDLAKDFTYKAIKSYEHQNPKSTGLLKDEWPQKASIPQYIVPGAMSGAKKLDSSAEEVFLLLFLMVGSSIFLLRPRNYKEKAQYCVIIPDVIDLQSFAKAIQRISTKGIKFPRFSNTYLGRVVGGAEEAALRFLIDIEADDISSERSVSGCIAVAMGKVAWDSKQINRSLIIKIKDSYPEISVFYAANRHLGKARIIKKEGAYAVPVSPVPELVAANLAAEKHWCTNFKSLVSEKKDFEHMNTVSKGGLIAMKEAIKDTDDQAIIQAFHEAWRRTMAEIYDRARRDGLNSESLIERERERVRNAILRAKTPDALASWFLRFCADATKGGALSSIRQQAGRIQKFIFNQRNFDRFQNLCLFALVSYSSDENNSKNGGNE